MLVGSFAVSAQDLTLLEAGPPKLMASAPVASEIVSAPQKRLIRGGALVRVQFLQEITTECKLGTSINR